MKEITLANGMIAAVDDEDFDTISQYRWSASSLNNFYATAKQGRIMHRVVMNAPRGTIVDHINSNPLDNRKANLRFVTKLQNGQSTRLKIKGDLPRGIREVDGRYFGIFYVKERPLKTQSFDTVSEAMRAYDALSIQLRGEYGFLHFPNGYSIIPDELAEKFSIAKLSPIPYPEDYFENS